MSRVLSEVTKSRLTALRLLCLFSLVPLTLFYVVAFAAAPSPPFLSLEGKWKFHSGDNLAWASPYFDDSDWELIEVPGGWKGYSYPATGWYRYSFRLLPELRGRVLGISLGRIRTADETFLNGVKIGSEGKIGDDFVEAYRKERVYLLPSHLLNWEGENLLAVRVQCTYLEGGIISGPLEIGDYNVLLLRAAERSHRAKMLEAITLTIFAGICLLSLALYLSGIKEREYLFLGLFILSYGVTYFLDSLTFYDMGLKSPMAQKLYISLTIAIPLVLIFFVFSVYRMRMRLYLKLLCLAFLILSLSYLVSSPSPKLYTVVTYLSLILSLPLIPLLLFYCVNGYLKERLPEFKSLLIGFIVLAFGAVIEILRVAHIKVLPIEESFHLSLFFFILCGTYALTLRYLRINKEHQFLSEHILTSQEEERKRIARELHDGPGQSLLALKLNLQMLEQRLSDGKVSLNRLITDVGEVVNELRDISLSLRPVFLEQVGLWEAIKWYVQRMSERTGKEFIVEGEEGLKVEASVQENLYRIFQEAMSNAIKHAEASRIKVALKREGQHLTLTIEDDGKGFDYYKVSQRPEGLGLLTMKERALLLGGTLSISSKRGKGTCLRVEVPIER